MPRILLATDFSDAAHAAFEHALALALAHRADLTLLHVGPEHADEVPWDEFPHVRKTLAAWGKGGDGPGSFRERHGIAVAKRAIRGRHVAAALIEAAEDRGADLLVLSRRALHGWGAPSVSAEAARRAPCAVLVVPEGAPGFVDPATGAVRLARVLAAVDRRPDPRAALREARRLAHAGLGAGEAPDIALELLHVGPAEGMPDVPDALLPNARITRTLREGDPAAVIAARAEETGADLVLMAREGRRSFADLLLGSTTERVLAAARRPVLAVPAEEASEG